MTSRRESDETTRDVDHFRELAARWEATAMRQAEAARDARETIMVGGRLPAGVEARVRARATADGVSVSDVVRAAIAEYVG